MTINCKDCGRTTPKFGRNIVEYKLCTECFRSKQSGLAKSKDQKEQSESKTAAVSQSGAFEVLNRASKKPTVGGTVHNLVFNVRSGWQTKNSKEQPMVTLEAQVDCNAYTQNGYKCPVAKKRHRCLVMPHGPEHDTAAGTEEAGSIVPMNRKMRAVNNEEIALSGATSFTLCRP